MNKEKIRVLQVMDKCAIRGSPIHGVSRLLLTWWPAFKNTDIELTLCVLRGGGGTCSAFEKKGINVEDLSRSKVDPRTVVDLIKIIKRDDIKILHCHGYGATTFGRLAGFLSNTVVVVQEHMVDKDIPLYQRIIDRLLAPLTSKGIAVSNAVNDFMVGPRSLPKNRMAVVYNTIPAQFCEKISDYDKSEAIRQYNIPKDVPLVGIIGRLDPVKGHDDFLRAASVIFEKHVDVHFIVVGDGELREKLENIVIETGLKNNVHFLGHCDNILPIISLLDIFVSSSHSEGLPMAHAEAMAQEKAVVATSVGGVPEIVENMISGILVPAKDHEKLAEAIFRILEDNALKIMLGKNALKRVRENFLVDETVKELSEIYRELRK